MMAVVVDNLCRGRVRGFHSPCEKSPSGTLTSNKPFVVIP